MTATPPIAPDTPQPGPRRRRRWRWMMLVLAGSLLGFVLFVAALAGIAIAWLDTPAGQRWLVATANRSLAEEGVRLGGLRGRLLGGWELETLSLSDDRGQYLVLREIEVQWRPRMLLQGTLALDKISLSEGRLLRLPASEAEEEAPAAFELPQLPFRVTLERFAIARFELGEPVFGVAASLSAGGRLRKLDDGRLLAGFEIARLDRADDRLEGGLEFDPETEALGLDIALTGAAGGLFAAALGAEAGESVSATLGGSGPIDEWTGRLEARLGERASLEAELRRRETRIELAGEASLEAMLPATYAGLAKPRLTVSLAADPASGGPVPIELALESDAGRLQAEGSLATEGMLAADLGFRLSLADVPAVRELAGGLAFSSLEAEGRLAGPLSRAEIDAKASIREPAFPDVGAADAARLVLRGTLGAEAIPLEAEMRLEALALAGLPALDPVLTLAGRYEMAAGRLAIARSRLAAGGIDLSATGEANLDGTIMSIEARLEAPALQSLAVSPDLPFAGTLTAEASLRRVAAGAPLRLSLQAEGRDITAKEGTLSDLLGRTPQLGLVAELAAGEQLTIDILRLDTAAAYLSAGGGVDLGASTLALDYELTARDLAAFVGTGTLAVAGQTTVTGQLAGRFDDLRAEARSEIAQLTLQGVDLVDLVLELRGSDLSGTPKLQLTADADSGFGAAHLGMRARLLPSGAVEVDSLRLSAGTTEIEGALRLAADGIVNGRLTGRTGDLAELPESRRYGVRGTLSLAVELSASEGGRQRIRAEAEGESLIIPAGGTEVLEIARLALDGTAVLSEPRPRIDARIELADARMGFSRLSGFTLEAGGDREALEITALAAGEWRGPLDLDARLVWSGTAEAQRIGIEAGGTVFGQPVALAEPATFSLGRTGWRLAPMRLEIGEGRLTLSAQRERERLAAELAADALPLALVNVIAPRLYPSGTMSAELQLEQTGGSVRGEGRLGLREVEPAVSGFAETPPFGLDAQINMADSRLSLTATAQAEDALGAEMQVMLPLEIDLLAGTMGVPQEAPLSGRFSWRGALAPMFMVVNLPQHEAYGDVTADLTLGGTPSDPDIGGSIAITGTRYEHLPSGFVARDLELRATLDNRRITLTELGAGDGEGGRLAGSGYVELAPDGLLADIEMRLERLHLLRRADVKAVASGELAFSATKAAMEASGELRPDRVEIDIGRNMPQSVVDIDVVEIETAAEDDTGGRAARREDGGAGPVGLQLSVNAPRRLFVRGRGLDSEWSADLDISGNSAEPRLQGSATIVKGVFEFAGRRFSLDGGELLFVGSAEIDPIIDLIARETVEELQVTLQIGGRLSAPTVSLSSTPGLPEDEILARLLFGESVADLSALQLVQLASAVGGLSGGGGFDVIGGARGLLGLDRLNITTGNGTDEDESGPTVAGGKYLTDNVYLEMSTETGTGVTAGTVEWSLTKNLSLESRVSSGRDNSIRVRWSWNY